MANGYTVVQPFWVHHQNGLLDNPDYHLFSGLTWAAREDWASRYRWDQGKQRWPCPSDTFPIRKSFVLRKCICPNWPWGRSASFPAPRTLCFLPLRPIYPNPVCYLCSSRFSGYSPPQTRGSLCMCFACTEPLYPPLYAQHSQVLLSQCSSLSFSHQYTWLRQDKEVGRGILRVSRSLAE